MYAASAICRGVCSATLMKAFNTEYVVPQPNISFYNYLFSLHHTYFIHILFNIIDSKLSFPYIIFYFDTPFLSLSVSYLSLHFFLH